MEPPLPGPDGFLLSPDDPLRAAHLRLNAYLLGEEQRSPATPFDAVVWRKLAERNFADQVQAVLERLRWLDEHDAELENAHLARIRLTALLRVLYSIKAPYTEPELRALLDRTIPMLGRIEPYGLVECIVEYLKNNDLTPELCRSLRAFQANQREEMSVSQASMRDFRTFSGERRSKWRALLKHLRGNAPVRMPCGWGRQTEPLMAAVGLDDFREQIHIWFAPFQSGEALPLSVAGSHVIKGFVWFCAVAKDDGLKECCLWLLDAKWRQKRNTEKVMVALGQLMDPGWRADSHPGAVAFLPAVPLNTPDRARYRQCGAGAELAGDSRFVYGFSAA